MCEVAEAMGSMSVREYMKKSLCVAKIRFKAETSRRLHMAKLVSFARKNKISLQDLDV